MAASKTFRVANIRPAPPIPPPLDYHIDRLFVSPSRCFRGGYAIYTRFLTGLFINDFNGPAVYAVFFDNSFIPFIACARDKLNLAKIRIIRITLCPGVHGKNRVNSGTVDYIGEKSRGKSVSASGETRAAVSSWTARPPAWVVDALGTVRGCDVGGLAGND